MARKAGILVWVVWQAGWFNAIIPGHASAAIVLPGASSCCAARTHYSNDGKPQAPTPQQREGCAICYFAAGLSTPDVFSIDLTPNQVSHRVAFQFQFIPPSPVLVLPYDACGPPVVTL